MDPKQDQGNTEEVLEQPQVAEDKQPEPMPSSEPNQTEAEADNTVTDQDNDDLALPEGVQERTRQQFEKLKAELAAAKAQAKSKADNTSYGDSVFDTFRPKQSVQQSNAGDFNYLNQTQVDAIANQFVDPEGNVDINGLNKALSSANQNAQRALQRAQSAEERLMRYEETQQVRDAHAVHPELDPSSKEFNPEFFEAVKDRLLRNMYEGKEQTLLNVANSLKKTVATPVNLDKVKSEAVTQYKTTQQNRIQGPIESGKGESRSTDANLQELRLESRKENILAGNTPSLDERLRNVGVFKKT